MTTRVAPTAVAGGLKFIRLVSGGAFTCGVRTDSSSACWGYGAWGQLGNGLREDHRPPVAALDGPNLVAASVGTSPVSAVAAGRTAPSSGKNYLPQPGARSRPGTATPWLVRTT